LRHRAASHAEGRQSPICPCGERYSGARPKKCHAKWLDSLHKQNRFIKEGFRERRQCRTRCRPPSGALAGRGHRSCRVTALHSRLTRVHGITPLGAEPLWRSWCKSPIWKSIRRHRLAVEPRCRQCAIEGRAVAASHVDHINPHLGRGLLFFKYENTQSLCAHHHNMHKQQEKRGNATLPPAERLARLGEESLNST
jgi:hypothetical protein